MHLKKIEEVLFSFTYDFTNELKWDNSVENITLKHIEHGIYWDSCTFFLQIRWAVIFGFNRQLRFAAGDKLKEWRRKKILRFEKKNWNFVVNKNEKSTSH